MGQKKRLSRRGGARVFVGLRSRCKRGRDWVRGWAEERSSRTSMSRSMFVGERAQETGGVERGGRQWGTGLGRSCRSKADDSHPSLRSSPMRRAPPRTGLGIDPSSEGAGAGGVGVRVGTTAKCGLRPSVSLLPFVPFVPPNGKGEGRVQKGKSRSGEGRSFAPPKPIRYDHVTHDTLTMFCEAAYGQ